MDRNVFAKSAKLFAQALFYRTIRHTLNQLVEVNLTEVQLACLRFVQLHPTPSVGAIAEGLSFSNAASAKLVDSISQKEIVDPGRGSARPACFKDQTHQGWGRTVG